MKNFLAICLLFTGVAGSALAGFPTPEIDSSTGAAALALISGGMLMLRSRRNKK